MTSLAAPLVEHRPPPGGPCRAVVTAIVPVRNEAAFIARTLDQLLDQDLAGVELEILVVDGQSTDATRDVVARYAQRDPRIRLLDNPQRLSSAARNLALGQAAGQYVVIIDGHCEIPSRRYFLDLVHAFEATGADCLGRGQPLDVADATTLQRAVAAARSSPLGHHPASYIYSDRHCQVPAGSVAVAYRRSVFDQVGPFDPRFDACEDYELNHRVDQAGLTCYLIPSLAVRYRPRNSLAGLFHQLARYGRGRVRMWRKHPESFSAPAFAPAAFFAGVAVGPLACAAAPALWPVYAMVVGAYVAAILAASLHAAFKAKSVAVLPWLPPVFLAVHLGSAWGVLAELLTGRRSFDGADETVRLPSVPRGSV